MRRARLRREPRSRPWLRSSLGHNAPSLSARLKKDVRRARNSWCLLIDLQSHSTVSDGQLVPAEVARAAAAAGVTTMSLTDHDAVAGVAEALKAAGEAGIECVPAVEMSCVHAYSDDLHMLGYWVDLGAIAPACDRAQGEREERALR